MFSKSQLEEIAKYLRLTAQKDTDFDNAVLPLIGNESLTIIQDGKNKIVSLLNILSKLGDGLKYELLSFEDYQALETKDATTLYLCTILKNGEAVIAYIYFGTLSILSDTVDYLQIQITANKNDITALKEFKTNVLKIKGAVASVSLLPTTGAIGDTYYIPSMQVFYACTVASTATTNALYEGLGGITDITYFINAVNDLVASNNTWKNTITAEFTAFKTAVNAQIAVLESSIDKYKYYIDSHSNSIAEATNSNSQKLTTKVDLIVNTFKEMIPILVFNKPEGYALSEELQKALDLHTIPTVQETVTPKPAWYSDNTSVTGVGVCGQAICGII